MGLGDWWLERRLRSPQPTRRSAALAALARRSGGDSGQIEDRFLEGVVAALEDENTYVARRAVEVLQARPDVRAAPAVARAFACGGDELSRGAQRTLERMGTQAVSALAREIPAPQPDRCAAAIALLGSWRGAVATPAVAACLDHASATVRVAAADFLGVVAAKDHEAALAARLSDSSLAVRAAAAKSLAALGWRAPSPELAAAAAVGRGDFNTARALGAPAAPALAAALEGDDRVREAAMATLAAIGGDAVPAVAALLPDKQRLWRAAEALGRIGGPRAAAALHAALDPKQAKHAVAPVLAALSVIRDPSSIDALGAALRAASERYEGEKIADALAAWQEAGAAALVLHLDERPAFVTPALVKLGRVALPALVRVLDDAVASRRSAAAKLLRQIGWKPDSEEGALLLAAGLGDYEALAAQGRRGLALLRRELSDGGYAFDKVIAALARLPGDDVTDLLVAEVRAGREGRSTAALQALASRDDARAIPTLVAALIDGHDQSWIANVVEEALRRAGAAAQPALVAAVREAPTERLGRVTKLLTELGWEATEPGEKARLLVATRRWPDVTRAAAADPEAYLAVLAVETSYELQGLEAAIVAADPSAMPVEVLVRYAGPDTPRAQETAVKLLAGKAKTRRSLEAVAPLTVALTDSSRQVRAIAARGLAGGPDVLLAETRAALGRALDDADSDVSCWAAEALLLRGEELGDRLRVAVTRGVRASHGALPEELRSGALATAIGLDERVYALARKAFDYDSREVGDGKYSNAVPETGAGDDAVAALCGLSGVYVDSVLQAIAAMPDRKVSLPCCAYSQDWTLDFGTRRRRAATELGRRGLPLVAAGDEARA